MVEVYLPDSLARLFPGRPRQATLPAGCVSELMWQLNTEWPGMRDRLCASNGSIRRHINVFVDGERATHEAVLRPGAVVQIIPAISGG